MGGKEEEKCFRNIYILKWFFFPTWVDFVKKQSMLIHLIVLSSLIPLLFS